MDIGNAIAFNTWCGDATIAIEDFDAETVTVRLLTNGMVKRYNTPADEYDWVAVIPFNEEYHIVSQSDDAGTRLIFTFTKNNL